MNLTAWAGAQGVHPQTAYRWFRAGTLPVPAVRGELAFGAGGPGCTRPVRATVYGLYARVSSHDQKDDLGRQVAWLTAWAAGVGGQVVRLVVLDDGDR